MILAAEYIPSPLRLILGRHSGIGNRIPRFPIFLPGIGEAIPDSRFGRETGNPRFPIRPGTGIGVPIRRAGDFCSGLATTRAKPGGPRIKFTSKGHSAWQLFCSVSLAGIEVRFFLTGEMK